MLHFSQVRRFCLRNVFFAAALVVCTPCGDSFALPAQRHFSLRRTGYVLWHQASNLQRLANDPCSAENPIRDVRCYPGADAFARIQNCLNELPVSGGTCDATSIQGPQDISSVLSISHPATVLFGDAVYTYDGSAVLINIHAAGVQLIGKGRGFDSGGNNRLGGSFGGRTQFVLSNPRGARHLVAVDSDNLTIQDISFIGPGINASSGGGISNTIAHNRNLESLVYRNVQVSDLTNTAISVDTPVSLLFENVLVRKGASDGMVFFNGGTTITCIQCFAITMRGRGMAFDDVSSVHVSGGAAESCGIGWDINNSSSVVLDATDAEVQVNRSAANPGFVGHGYRINGSTKVTLVSPNSRAVPARDSRHFLITGKSNDVRIVAPRIIQGQNTPEFDIETGTGSAGIKLDGLDPVYTLLDNATGTIIEDLKGNITAAGVNVTGAYRVKEGGIPVAQLAPGASGQCLVTKGAAAVWEPCSPVQSVFSGVYGGGLRDQVGVVNETAFAYPVTIRRLAFTIAAGGQLAPVCSAAQPSVSIYDQPDASAHAVAGKPIVGPLWIAPRARGASAEVNIPLPAGHLFQLVYSSGSGCPSQPTQVNLAATFTTN